MNLPLCLWLWSRAVLKGDRVEMIVHEPFLALGEGTWKQSGAAIIHRLMVAVLLMASSHIWVTIPEWERLLRPYAYGRRLPFTWLPVASNIPVCDEPTGRKAVRELYAERGELVVGHFGTYGAHVRNILMGTVPTLMKNSEGISLLLMGRGSEALRDAVIDEYPDLARCIHATGELNSVELSRAVKACDVMLQPYPDGISSRRTSAMTALSHGIPVVTTSGHLTESFWAQSGAVAIVPSDDTAGLVNITQRLLRDIAAREKMGAAAKRLYLEHFDISRTIHKLCAASTVSLDKY